MKSILTIIAAAWIAVSIFSHINYMAAKQAVQHTERTDADICNVMQLYGFDLDGNPNKDITYTDKIKAFFTTNK
jgi:hypothetical protein